MHAEQYRTSLVYALVHAYLEKHWGTMMGRSTAAVLLLHAAAAFQFHEDKCEPTTSLPTAEDSKRVAFILRGDAYRGLSYGSTARGSKRGFMCTPFAVRIQRAISQSHVDYIIAPLEAAGFVVDVFFATYGCPDDAEKKLDYLRGFYDRNRTRVVHIDRIPRPGATQATPANIAMKSLRRLWPKEGYRSVLIWRFDLVATCVEINQCVGCTRQFFTKSFFGDDAADLAPSSGEEPASPRHRAGIASMAGRTTR